MPVSVVVGGQYGSEGKGKVAQHIARKTSAAFVIRVGGTNSGHTAVGSDGNKRAFRQLPASMLETGAIAVLPAGAIIDPEILLREASSLGFGVDQIYVSPYATVISAADKAAAGD